MGISTLALWLGILACLAGAAMLLAGLADDWLEHRRARLRLDARIREVADD